MSWWWVVAAVVAIALFGLYLSMTAGRLDALHKRIDTSRLSLDAQLLRRSSVALELATSGVLDPAGAIVVAEAARDARTAADEDSSATDRADAETALTQALCVTLDAEEVAEVRSAPGGSELLAELAASAQRVQLSRRFLNDAVRAGGPHGPLLVVRHRLPATGCPPPDACHRMQYWAAALRWGPTMLRVRSR